jgi:hypothetical protein
MPSEWNSISRGEVMETNDRFHTEQQAEPDSKKSKHAKHVHSVRPRHEETAVREVSIYIEQEDKNKFKIRTDQLEQIGAKLRGRRQFSVFQSVILPLIVGGSIFTYLFQYVSWSNQVAVHESTEVATNAARTYEKVAALMSTRFYAEFVFLPSLRDLVGAKGSVEKRRSDAEKSPQPPATGMEDLQKTVLDMKRQRFLSYYEQIKIWNDNFDRLLSEVEITLDRPVFRQANEKLGPISFDQLYEFNCLESPTQELEKVHLNPNSLKGRFAGITRCFVEAGRISVRPLDEAISGNLPTVDEGTKLKVSKVLSNLNDQIAIFRCYALSRLDYYISEKQLSILTISSVLKWLTDPQKEMVRAQKHFEDTANRCNPRD